MFFLYKSFAGCSLKSHITPSLRAFPYCSNLRQFSIKFLIVRKRGSRHSHRQVSSSHYATRSRAKKIHTRPFTCTNRQVRRSKARRLAARVPSANRHIPLIRTPWTSVRLTACVRSAPSPSKHSHGIGVWLFTRLVLIAKILCAVSDCENKCGAKQ